MARSTNAAEQPNWGALKQLTDAGLSSTSIRRLSKATPDQLEVAGIRSKGNPTQANWGVNARRHEPGPWSGLLAKVHGAPKMPRVRQS
jgi:hypothetical protein